MLVLTQVVHGQRTLASMVRDSLEGWEDQTSQNTLWTEQVLETKRSYKAQSTSSTIEKKAEGEDRLEEKLL